MNLSLVSLVYEKTLAPDDLGARVVLVLVVCNAVRFNVLCELTIYTGQFVRIKIERQLVLLARVERNHSLLV